MGWSCRGLKGQNAAAPLVYEYITRMKLSKIGYSFNPDELDSFTAGAFCLIASEIDAFKEKEMKANKPRKK